MPLIATCSRYRRQGMCRRLLTAIEEMLISVKVEKLVIAAIPDLVGTWTEGFGFIPVEDREKQSLNKINLMVFPGTVLLKKPLCENKTAYRQHGNCDTSSLGMGGMRKQCFRYEDRILGIVHADVTSCGNKTGAKVGTEFVEGTNVGKSDVGSKLFITAETGLFGTPEEGKKKLTEVGVHSRDIIDGFVEKHVVQSSGNIAGTEMEIKSKSCAKTGIEAVKQFSGTCYADILADAVRLVEDIQDFKASTKAELVKTLQPSVKICCRMKEVDELETKQMTGRDLLEPEVGNEPEGRVFNSSNMQVEAKVGTLQDQFSNLSCEEPASAVVHSQPEKLTNVKSLEMYDEILLSVDEQSQR